MVVPSSREPREPHHIRHRRAFGKAGRPDSVRVTEPAGEASGRPHLRENPEATAFEEAERVRETYHIEVLGPEEAGAPGGVQQRISVRSATLEGAAERARRLFARARVPQRSGTSAEAVRIVDGAGAEVFRMSRFDEA